MFFGKTRRTRRTTKAHEGGTADYGRTQRLTEGNRGTQRRAAATAGWTHNGSLEVWRLGSLDRPNAARLSQRTRRTTKVHKEHDAGGGAGRACAKAHVRPGGPVGAWRASHAMLWGVGNPAATAPSYRSYTSYWSYRVVSQSANQPISQSAGRRYCRPLSYRGVLWHVADVPGVQGRVEVWKLGCLEVWLSRCTTISPVARLSGVLFSVAVEGLALWACTLCSPFSGAR